jgi:hypothetical protein
LKALEWIVDHTKLPRLLDASGRPDFNVSFYTLDRRGRHAMVSIWSGGKYTVHDGTRAGTVDGAWLFRKEPRA